MFKIQEKGDKMRTGATFRSFGIAAAALLVFGALATAAFAAGTPAGTVISNFAIGNYKDANGNALAQVTSNTVTTTVTQVAGSDATPATATQGIGPGVRVTYPATITNTGNGSDSLTIALNTTGLPSGWTAAVYRDANGDGILQQSEIDAGPVTQTGTLAADGIFKVIVAVTSDAQATSGTSGTVILTTTSTFNSTVSDTGTFTTTIAAAVIYMTKSASPTSPKPGDVVTYTIAWGNSGTDTAYAVVIRDTVKTNTTYIANSVTIGGASQTDASDGDKTTVSGGVITVNWGSSPPAQTSTITFQARVNAGVAAGATVGNVAVVNYQSPAGNAQPAVTSNTSTLTIAALAGVSVAPDSMHTDQQTGDTNLHPFTVTNTGNSNDTYDLTSWGRYWVWEIWRDLDGNKIIDDGDYKITDTDGDGKGDTGALASGVSAAFVARTTVPAGSSDGQMGLHIVTATSSVDTSVSDTSKKSTAVHAPVLTLAKSVSPTGSQPPGTVLTYTTTYNNTGSGYATTVVLVDQIPTSTTYVTGSIKVDGVAQTDSSDTDYAKLETGSVIVSFPTLGASTSGTFSFQVKIK